MTEGLLTLNIAPIAYAQPQIDWLSDLRPYVYRLRSRWDVSFRRCLLSMNCGSAGQAE
jgi:hypothetical protein